MISSSSIMRRYQTTNEFYRHKQSFRQSRFRYLALFLACMIMLGDAYCFDNPMALQSEIQTQFGVDNFQFNLLYTVYSLPNIVLPFFGGLLIDKLGARLAILLFSTIIVVGQVICVVGAYYTLFWVMILGRVVFGIGSESLNISQNSIMAQWFRDKEMSLAIGLCISIPKIGSAINSYLSPLVINEGGSIAQSMLIGVGFLIFSYVCGLMLIYMDKESDRREQQSKRMLDNFLSQNEELFSDKKVKQVEVHSFTKYKLPPDEIEEKFEQEKDNSSDTDSDGKNDALLQTELSETREEIKLSQIAKMSGTFWILIIICMLTEALFVPFLDNGNDFLQVRYKITGAQAGKFLIVPYVISAIATPFLGTLIDRIGRRGWMIILTSFIFLGTHLLLLFLTCDSYCLTSVIPLFSLGICFAFYASVVIPSVPLVVKPHLIGTAFGLTGVFQNTALAFFPLITGMLFNQFSNDGQNPSNKDPNRGYTYQSYFFVGMSIFNTLIAISLLVIDRTGARSLQGKGNQNNVIMEKIKKNDLKNESRKAESAQLEARSQQHQVSDFKL